MDRNILAQDVARLAGVHMLGGLADRDAEIIPRTANRIEHGLGGRQETVAIRPSVIVRAAILVLLRQVKLVRCILRRPRPALIGAVFAHEQPAIQRVIVGRETKGIAVTISP